MDTSAAKKWLSDLLGLLPQAQMTPDKIVPAIGELIGPTADLWQSNKPLQEKVLRTGGTLAELLAGPVSSALTYSPEAQAATVWHGSPHKFLKFLMSKIGTGEGAQAYGHGLYFAESPEVAKSYRDALSEPLWMYKGDKTNFANDSGGASGRSKAINEVFDEMQRNPDLAPSEAIQKILSEVRGYTRETPKLPNPHILRHELKKLDPQKFVQAGDGQLYKVDIPDEAVARFLDWDKPLSQQKGVAEIKPVSPSYDGQFGTGEYGGYAWHIGDTQVSRASRTPELLEKYAPLGSDIVRDLNAAVGRGTGHQELLQQAGIPGIRYLDGGSRSAGQGSSNYVLFDDQMPRIIDVNGVPTGNKPWEPGEWLQLRDLMNSGLVAP